MANKTYDINEKKANRLTRKILKLENENLKTKQYSRSEMSDQIIKLIEEEVKKCY